jgi:hypothetical protein
VIDRISNDTDSAELQFKGHLKELMETEIQPWELALQQPAANFDVALALTSLSDIKSLVQRLSALEVD